MEFDAYRMDLESLAPTQNLEETQQNYTRYKETYEKLRDDVTVKMQFLDENRVSYICKSKNHFYEVVSFPDKSYA